MIRYFISYLFQNASGLAAGNCELTLTTSITSLQDVSLVVDYLRSKGITNPTVMSFCRIDDDAEQAHA